MRVYRILISFVAGTVIVLAMLVAGLKLFSGRQTAPVPVADEFTVEYLAPEQASRLLGKSVEPQSDRQDTDPAEPDRSSGGLQQPEN